MTSSHLSQLRVGYLPISQSLGAPGDRRRFVAYARARNLPFDLVTPSGKYDVVVLTQKADLSVWSRYPRGTRLVYDFTDSYLAVPRDSLKGRLRGAAKYISGQSKYPRLNHWRALEDMCRRADAVVCTTQEQAERIRPFCENVHTILDVHTTVVNTVKTDYRAGDTFNLVWEGLPGNLYAFNQLRKALAQIQGRRRLALHLVTDLSYRRYLGFYGHTDSASVVKGVCDRIFLYEWNEHMFGPIVCACDLAIIPIDLTDPLVTGKPENKLVLFWRMGMPAVTAATPAYDRAMEQAGLRMTCRSESDWLEILEKYMTDESARRHAGEAGRRIAETCYGPDVMIRRWDNVMESLGYGGGPG